MCATKLSEMLDMIEVTKTWLKFHCISSMKITCHVLNVHSCVVTMSAFVVSVPSWTKFTRAS